MSQALRESEELNSDGGLFGVIALSLSEPGEERLGRLPHLLAGWEVDLLLASLAAPLSKNRFAQDILVVEKHEDLGCQVVDIWVIFASEPNESFYTSKKCLFMFLGSD